MTKSGAWPSERLKHAADLAFSSVDKTTVEGEIAVKLCNYTDVYYNDQITADMPFMEATASLDRVRRFGLRAGDVLITKDSETADDIGVAAFVPETLDGVVCGYHLAVLRPKRDRVDPKYLFWGMASAYTREQMTVFASGVTRYGLRFGDLANLRLMLPELDKQRAAARFLDSETARIDALIQSKGRLLTALENRYLETVRWVTARGVRGDVRETSEVSQTSSLPVGWRMWRLGHAFRIGSGTTPDTGSPEFYGGGIPWITSELRDGPVKSSVRRVTPEALKRYSTLEIYPAGSLVVAMYGATIGRLGLLEVEATTNQACCVLYQSSVLLPQFVLYWMLANREHLLSLAVGGGQGNISQETIRNLRVPTPPDDEQRAIVEFLDTEKDKLGWLESVLRKQVGLLT